MPQQYTERESHEAASEWPCQSPIAAASVSDSDANTASVDALQLSACREMIEANHCGAWDGFLGVSEFSIRASERQRQHSALEFERLVFNKLRDFFTSQSATPFVFMIHSWQRPADDFVKGKSRREPSTVGWGEIDIMLISKQYGIVLIDVKSASGQDKSCLQAVCKSIREKLMSRVKFISTYLKNYSATEFGLFSDETSSALDSICSDIVGVVAAPANSDGVCRCVTCNGKRVVPCNITNDENPLEPKLLLLNGSEMNDLDGWFRKHNAALLTVRQDPDEDVALRVYRFLVSRLYLGPFQFNPKSVPLTIGAAYLSVKRLADKFWTVEQRKAILDIEGIQFIVGPAGTGKTWIILHRMFDLIKENLTQGANHKILFVNHTAAVALRIYRALRDHLVDGNKARVQYNGNVNVSDPHVWVFTYEGFRTHLYAMENYDNADAKLQWVAIPKSERVPLMDDLCHTVTVGSFGLGDRGFSHIFLDEAQDFIGNFLAGFRNISCESQGLPYVIRICMDPFHQQAFSESNELLDGCEKEWDNAIVLKDVFRQSTQLNLVSMRYLNLDRLHNSPIFKRHFLDKLVGRKRTSDGSVPNPFTIHSVAGPEVKFHGVMAERNFAFHENNGIGLRDAEMAAVAVDEAWSNIKERLRPTADPYLNFQRDAADRHAVRDVANDEATLISSHLLVLVENNTMAYQLKCALRQRDYSTTRAGEEESSDCLLCRVPLRDCAHLAKQRVIVVESIVMARGLEAPIVIVYDPPLIGSAFLRHYDADSDEPEPKYYMAFTRAMCLMEVLTTYEGKRGFEVAPHVPGRPNC